MRTPVELAVVAAALVALAAVGWTAFRPAADAAPSPVGPSPIGPPDEARSDGAGGSSGGGMAMCIEGVPDCDDMVVVPGGDEPVGHDVGDEPVGHDVGDDPQIVEANPDAVDLRARAFDNATVVDDGRTVSIDFMSGAEPCYVLGKVKVVEGDDAVTITLFEGHLDLGEDVACIDLGVFKRTTVILDEPLGDRSIVDGAAAA